MRELCPNCYGIGTMCAENWHYADLSGRPITGDIACYNCRGKGFKDWHNTEAHKWGIERRQQSLRAAVDLGGSVYSQESRFFKVEEVRWGAITSVYFQPKVLCTLLGMVFPGDVSDTEAAVKNASWDPGKGWIVTPKTGEREHVMFSKAIEMQLVEQVDLWSMPPGVPSYMPRDDRYIAYLNNNLNYSPKGDPGRKGKIGRSWRDAVAAVKAQRSDAQAA